MTQIVTTTTKNVPVNAAFLSDLPLVEAEVFAYDKTPPLTTDAAARTASVAGIEG